jgi:hypothetical protein
MGQQMLWIRHGRRLSAMTSENNCQRLTLFLTTPRPKHLVWNGYRQCSVSGCMRIMRTTAHLHWDGVYLNTSNGLPNKKLSGALVQRHCVKETCGTQGAMTNSNCCLLLVWLLILPPQKADILNLLHLSSLILSWSWALAEKLPIVQLLKNFPAFCGTRRFITVFTWALH